MLIKRRMKYMASTFSRIWDKLVNTFLWLFSNKKDIVLLNVWLRQRGNNIYPTNIGDDLNYAIITFLTKKRLLNCHYSYIGLFRPVNYMCIGSIVDTLTNENSIIWGSGALYGNQNNYFVRPKKVFAVRGPRTRSYLLSQGVSCPEIYGDPAVLLPVFYPCEGKRKYRVGLIPHIIDFKEPNVKEFAKHSGVTVIDIRNYTDWKDVVKKINECDFIASSSLHGIILADAYKVPNVWVKITDCVKGEGFKFFDYFESCGRKTLEPINFINIPIDDSLIIEQCLLYKEVTHDLNSLLKSCPFLSPEVRGELRKKGVLL